MDLITLIRDEAFEINSMPIILRFALERSEGLEEALQALQLDLQERFQGLVIVTPADHQTAYVEQLKFKVGFSQTRIDPGLFHGDRTSREDFV